MTTQNDDQQEGKGQVDTSAIEDAVAKAMGAGFDKVGDTLADRIAKAAQPLRKEEEQVDDDWNWNDIFDEEDKSEDKVQFTRAQLEEFQKNIVQQAVKQAQEKMSGNFDEMFNERQSSIAMRNRRDQEAYEKFPELNPKNGRFNKDFADKVLGEMQRRIQSGRQENDPDLLFDSASVVMASNPEIMKMSYLAAEREQREFNNRQSAGYSVRGAQPGKSEGLSEAQLKMAKRMGVNVDKMKKRRGIT